MNLAWKLLEWVRTKHQGHSGQTCSVFTDLELYRIRRDEEITAVNNKQRPNRSHNIIRISKIENAIIEIIQENDNKGKQTDLGEIGSRLQKKIF